MLTGWARVQWKRIRRRESSVLRTPQATRLTCLNSRLTPSLRALLRPVCRKARIAGHQVSIVVARRGGLAPKALLRGGR